MRHLNRNPYICAGCGHPHPRTLKTLRQKEWEYIDEHCFSTRHKDGIAFAALLFSFFVGIFAYKQRHLIPDDLIPVVVLLCILAFAGPVLISGIIATFQIRKLRRKYREENPLDAEALRIKEE